jgi:hypothetical protein
MKAIGVRDIREKGGTVMDGGTADHHPPSHPPKGCPLYEPQCHW